MPSNWKRILRSEGAGAAVVGGAATVVAGDLGVAGAAGGGATAAATTGVGVFTAAIMAGAGVEGAAIGLVSCARALMPGSSAIERMRTHAISIALTCSLPYRGFLIRKAPQNDEALECLSMNLSSVFIKLSDCISIANYVGPGGAENPVYNSEGSAGNGL